MRHAGGRGKLDVTEIDLLAVSGERDGHLDGML